MQFGDWSSDVCSSDLPRTLSQPPDGQDTRNSTWTSPSYCSSHFPSPFPPHADSCTFPRPRLLFASIMYERTCSTKRDAIKGVVFPGPTDIDQALERSRNAGRIQQFARRLQIEFEPVSELSSMSSAYCALFWDANANWIVIAFKGSYSESDLAWLDNRLIRIQGLHQLSLMVRPSHLLFHLI